MNVCCFLKRRIAEDYNTTIIFQILIVKKIISRFFIDTYTKYKYIIICTRKYLYIYKCIVKYYLSIINIADRYLLKFIFTNFRSILNIFICLLYNCVIIHEENHIYIVCYLIQISLLLQTNKNQ